MKKLTSPRALAEKSGLSYVKIAEKLDASLQSVYNWCRVDGKQRDPSYKKYARLESLANGEKVEFEENKK